MATKLMSWNLRAINNPKRSKVFSHLRDQGVEIVYLQETHLLNRDHLKLCRGGFYQVYHSDFNSKGRGVAILIHRNVQFVETTTIKDKHGRYVIVVGKLFNMPVVLANIYAPNWDNVQFFKDLFSLLPNLDTHNLILGGDLNCVLDSTLDRSSPTPSVLSKSAQCINSFCKVYGIFDPWRYVNPTSRQYSFYSPPHRTYTRIDYFLLDNKLTPIVTGIEYSGIVISDHSPVILKLHFPENTPPQRMWRLNNRLLADDNFTKFINSQIVFFLELNDTPDISSAILWESLKAYIRGQIISYNAGERKRKMKRTTELTKAIKEVDLANSRAPSEELHKKRILFQTEYDILINQREEDLYLRSRQDFYEHGERAGKLLSHQLKQSAAAGMIVEIGDNLGNKIIDQKGINNQFKSFYKDLYTSEVNDRERVKNFFGIWKCHP